MNIDFGNPFVTRLKQVFFRFWRPGLLVLTLGSVVYLLYFRRLAILLPGYSAPEVQAFMQSANWHTIGDNPVNAPYLSLVWLLTAVAHHNLLATRVVAACFGILAVVTFYAVIRPWYSFRVATLGTLLFATSASFLHIARFGTPQVLQMSILLFLLCALWYKRSPNHRTLMGYILVAACALVLYVPGMVWFVGLGAVLLRRTILHQLRRVPLMHLVNAMLLLLVLLAPLIRATVASPHLLLSVSGLPANLDAVSDIASNFYHAILTLGIHSNGNPFITVGHAPLLNASELVLGALGLYTYAYRERSLRATFVIGAAAIGLLLISFGGSVSFAILVPLLYLFIVHGLDYLLKQWFTVFPRNPIARSTGVAIVCVLLLASVFYQIRVYFIAWPHNTATRQAFSLSHPTANLLQ